jgi:hypothetical protein
LRRTAIHDLLEEGHSLQAVQPQFGLLGVVALAHYDQCDPSDPRWYQGRLEREERSAHSLDA